jgi:hypothetical protein
MREKAQPSPVVPRQVAGYSQVGYLGAMPSYSVGHFRGPHDTLKLMSELALGDQGERSMVVRRFTEWVVAEVMPKDYLGEILAIRNMFVQPSPWRHGVPLFRYTNDARHVEIVKSPERQVREIDADGTTVVDCDEIAAMAATCLLQLGRKVEFVAIGFAPNSLTHVALRAEEPKSQRWIWIDGVAGPREKTALAGAKELLVWSLD